MSGPLTSLEHETDWHDTGALVTKSYYVLAPKKLAKLADAAPG
jgi:hypothetical protein